MQTANTHSFRRGCSRPEYQHRACSGGVRAAFGRRLTAKHPTLSRPSIALRHDAKDSATPHELSAGNACAHPAGVSRWQTGLAATPPRRHQVREMGKMSYVPRPGAGSQHVVTVGAMFGSFMLCCSTCVGLTGHPRRRYRPRAHRRHRARGGGAASTHHLGTVRYLVDTLPRNPTPGPSRFDNVSGTDKRGNPVHDLPNEVLDSIRRNRTYAHWENHCR